MQSCVPLTRDYRWRSLRHNHDCVLWLFSVSYQSDCYIRVNGCQGESFIQSYFKYEYFLLISLLRKHFPGDILVTNNLIMELSLRLCDLICKEYGLQFYLIKGNGWDEFHLKHLCTKMNMHFKGCSSSKWLWMS